jgi:hypothetical protein
MARFKCVATSPGEPDNVIPYTSAEDTIRDADEAASEAANDARIATQPMRDWQQNRISAYGSVGDQLDMQYWDGVNDTTVWPDHIAQVKADHPKPT